MPIGFFLDLSLELLEVREHFALLLHREDPCVARVVVDEGDVVAASAECWRLSRSHYVRVNYVEEAFDCRALLREWESMLFFELACIAHSVDSFRLEGRKSDDDSLRLHRVKPLEFYVADSLVPQLNVCLGFETFGVHGRFYLVRIEDEHATFSPSLGYDSTISLDEASVVVETDLHALLHDLSLMQVFSPSFPNGKSPMCRMGCGVSSPVSM